MLRGLQARMPVSHHHFASSPSPSTIGEDERWGCLWSAISNNPARAEGVRRSCPSAGCRGKRLLRLWLLLRAVDELLRCVFLPSFFTAFSGGLYNMRKSC